MSSNNSGECPSRRAPRLGKDLDASLWLGPFRDRPKPVSLSAKTCHSDKKPVMVPAARCAAAQQATCALHDALSSFASHARDKEQTRVGGAQQPTELRKSSSIEASVKNNVND